MSSRSNVLDVFNSIKFLKQSNTLVSSGTTASTQQIQLDPGYYILIASTRSVEYSGVFTLTGDNSIKQVGMQNFYNFDIAFPNYQQGRGSGVTTMYTLCLQEVKTLTFGIASNNSSYNAAGSLGIYTID